MRVAKELLPEDGHKEWRQKVRQLAFRVGPTEPQPCHRVDRTPSRTPNRAPPPTLTSP